jgi:hypothetical protein
MTALASSSLKMRPLFQILFLLTLCQLPNVAMASAQKTGANPRLVKTGVAFRLPTVQVRAYKKASGTRVKKHIRTYPDAFKSNNFKSQPHPPL